MGWLRAAARVRAVAELGSHPRRRVADSLSRVQASRPHSIASDGRIRETAEDITVAEERAPYEERGEERLERLDEIIRRFLHTQRWGRRLLPPADPSRAGHPPMNGSRRDG